MASSKLAARSIRNHAKYKGRNDLNIVPMIDMMVILVFFLLFTAVFSTTTILELNLPAPPSSVPELQKGLTLEAMNDMMVVLVFFLLFTAVFSNTNSPELNLPAPNSAVPELPKGLNREVIVRADRIEIADRNSGILRSLPKKEGEYDYQGL